MADFRVFRVALVGMYSMGKKEEEYEINYNLLINF